jgi:two-component system, NarL family, sensor histidine kinase DevS
VDALDETIREIRSSIFALQAREDTKPPSLRARILHEADQAAGLLGFPPSLQLDGRLDEGVPDDLGEQLIVVLREALANAARHAGASKVDVLVRAAADLALTVRDNGSGISASGRRSGLANMEQRAVKLGGSFRAEPLASGGTELAWQVPLTKPAG